MTFPPSTRRSDRCSILEGRHPLGRRFSAEPPLAEEPRQAAAACRGCDLYKYATQTVFGEGPARARLMLVGEEPGDSEDLEGHPFVGPAGKLLHRAMETAGIAPRDVYVTNAVKHFKFVERGKRRIHQKPKIVEIRACRPWLQSEIAVVKPRLIVALGATAAQSLLGSTFRLMANRGRIVPGHPGSWRRFTRRPSFGRPIASAATRC